MGQEIKKSLTQRLRDTHNEEADATIPDLQEAQELTGSTQFILCRCGDVSVSFPIVDVKELVATEELKISALPSLKKPNVGIVRRKGDLIPMASLAAVIGVGVDHASRSSGRAVICHMEIKGKPHSFGLLVDEVVAVIAVENHLLSSVSQKVTEAVASGAGIFYKIFKHEKKEYRVIDTLALYRYLTGTIERRNVIE